MKKITLLRTWLGFAAAWTVPLCLADGARGQNAQAVPMAMPAIDTATLQKAAANGEVMLRHAKWSVPLNLGNTSVRAAGEAIVCEGHIGLTTPANRVLDRQTGQVLWEGKGRVISRLNGTIQRPDAPLVWTKEGLVHFVEDDAQLSLWMRSADHPNGMTLWTTKYDVPPDQLNPRTHVLVPSATFADQQVIAGEEVSSRAQGGNPSPTPDVSLTIRSFDRGTGHLQWATPVPGMAVAATVTDVAEGRVYVLVTETSAFIEGRPAAITHRNGFVMGLSAADGKVLWKSPSGIRAINAAVRKSVLVTLAENGDVIAYDGRSGKEYFGTPLSLDCDPAKSKMEMLNVTDDRLYLDKEGILVTLTKLGDLPADVPVTLSNAVRYSREGGIAVLDPLTGRQSGYFNDRGVTDQRGNPIQSLSTHGETLIAQVGRQACIGVDRKTLKLKWYIPAISSAMADDAVYIVTAVEHNPEATVIQAVPVDVAG